MRPIPVTIQELLIDSYLPVRPFWLLSVLIRDGRQLFMKGAMVMGGGSG